MLNRKQKKLIPLIINCENIDQACKQAQISRQTYYDWLKDKEFNKELKKQQDSIYKNALIELKNLNTVAIKVYRDLLDSNDESIKFRTASAILELTNKLIENKEIKEKLETIEDRLNK